MSDPVPTPEPTPTPTPQPAPALTPAKQPIDWVKVGALAVLLIGFVNSLFGTKGLTPEQETKLDQVVTTAVQIAPSFMAQKPAPTATPSGTPITAPPLAHAKAEPDPISVVPCPPAFRRAMSRLAGEVYQQGYDRGFDIGHRRGWLALRSRITNQNRYPYTEESKLEKQVA